MKKSTDKVEILGTSPTSSEKEMKELNFRPYEKRAAIPLWVWVLLVIASVLFLAGFITLMVAVTKKPSCEGGKVDGDKGNAGSDVSTPSVCKFSAEADRVNLPDFLKRVHEEHYTQNKHYVIWRSDVVDMQEHAKRRFAPYNPDPKYLKQKADKAKELLQEINSIKIDENKMKPREVKALSQVKHFLQHTFGAPYSENYYAGDWMLGPDVFCWQLICNLYHILGAFVYHVKPKTFKDVELVINTFKSHKTSIDRYRENMKLGVKAGMIRTVIDCQAGVDALKEKYRQLSLADNSKGILREDFVKNYILNSDYLANLEDGVEQKWSTAHNGMSVNDSLKDALKEGVGQPLLDLINYLQTEHRRHCLPNDFASGLANLPVDYVYTDGIADKSQPTTKILPTGEKLNGKESYKMILSYFTTTDISPEDIFAEGKRQLDFFYGQVVDIAKKYTGKSNETEAIQVFRDILNSSSMWHNNGSFPKNESDENAFKKCTSPQTAAQFCPVRWKAVNKWARYCRQVMGMLYPKITNAFYFTGSKNTVPNCPVEMLPHYNPSNGAQFFMMSDAECSKPTYFGLPFFLKDFGPIFQEWSVTGHEARPGHHTQVQGQVEHFADQCGGIPGWLDNNTYYTAFTEGWGLYSENPILSDDTDTYKDNLLQKYGMVKWQTWRAVRLIVDTGLHYRGLSRTEALAMFEKYAWDTSDFAVKEVTRYQSVQGQATAYMLGRLALMQLRNKTKEALGNNFNLKDFHYQVLSQGSAPLSFLQSYIDRYIKCMKKELGNEECSYVLKPVKPDKTAKAEVSAKQMPPMIEKRHYV